jgi:hypothetical protein
MMRVFCAGSGSSLILGCDPRLLRADDTAFRAAAAAFVGDASGEHWWPGPVGPLPGVRQLLPNHLLRLETGQMRRCWPLQELRPQPLSQAVSRCCELLESAFGGLDGLPEGLCMGLTAGLDSRVLLAASKAVADRCACFTFQYPGMSAGHEDVRVPRRLAELFGLDHVVIPTRETMSDEFAGVYRAHVTAAHDCWGPLAEAMSASPLAPRLMVKACPGGELVYEAYGPFRDEMTDVRVLRRLGHLPDEDCVWESLEWWYKDAAAAPRGPELRIAELYAWEQSTSCWQASSQEEYGLVQATFSPFDCRAVYEIGLSVERKYRSGWVGAVFQKRLIETMWPELLAVPINPVKHSAQRRMRARLRRAVPRAHLLRLWLKEGRRLRKRSP